MNIGIAQYTSIKLPNTKFPAIAPMRAASKVTASAVDLQKIYTYIYMHKWSNIKNTIYYT